MKVPVEVNVQESALVPEPATLAGVRVHAALLAERLTVPVKPPVGVMVIVEVPAAPTFTLTVVGLAAMVKSAGTSVMLTVKLLWKVKVK